LQFPVVERIAAGAMPAQALASGQVAYITTGSPVPDGADAIVKIEDTSSVDGSDKLEREVAVNILKAVKEGQNVRAIGSDIRPGEVLVDAHELVEAAEIGLLATVSWEDMRSAAWQCSADGVAVDTGRDHRGGSAPEAGGGCALDGQRARGGLPRGDDSRQDSRQ
jgi:hypothetical protein